MAPDVNTDFAMDKSGVDFCDVVLLNNIVYVSYLSTKEELGIVGVEYYGHSIEQRLIILEITTKK